MFFLGLNNLRPKFVFNIRALRYNLYHLAKRIGGGVGSGENKCPSKDVAT